MAMKMVCENCGHTADIQRGRGGFFADGFGPKYDLEALMGERHCQFCDGEADKAVKEAQMRASLIREKMISGAREQALLRARTQRRNQTQ